MSLRNESASLPDATASQVSSQKSAASASYRKFKRRKGPWYEPRAKKRIKPKWFRAFTVQETLLHKPQAVEKESGIHSAQWASEMAPQDSLFLKKLPIEANLVWWHLERINPVHKSRITRIRVGIDFSKLHGPGRKLPNALPSLSSLRYLHIDDYCPSDKDVLKQLMANKSKWEVLQSLTLREFTITGLGFGKDSNAAITKDCDEELRA